MEDRRYIKTSDIELATTLFTLGIPIDGIYASDRLSPLGEPIMEFYLREDARTLDLIRQYYARKLQVEPMILLLNRKEMVSRLKDEQRQAKNEKSS